MTPVALKSRRRLLVLLARLGGCCIATGEVLAAITTDAVNGQELFYGVDVETKHLDKIVEGYLEAYGRVQFPLDRLLVH